MKVVTIVGARPQFIKAAAVSRAIAEYNKNRTHISPLVDEVIIHTGQHYDENMSDIFFDELQIPLPNYQLETREFTHGAMIGRMIERIEKVLICERPDVVLVYGDTNTTLAGAVTSAKLNIPVAHVEAGLRSFNRKMPEEINRVLTDHVSTILFCPTETAVSNLKREGFANIISPSIIEREKYYLNSNSPIILKVGDVMYDSLLFYSDEAEKRSNVLSKFGLKKKNYALATIHRAENTDNLVRLRDIIESLVTISKDLKVIWPVHPRNEQTLNQLAINFNHDHFIKIKPQGYLDFLQLERNSRIVLTDSGGVQKEAYLLGVPCITLREETEWIETVQNGMNILVGANRESIEKAYLSLNGMNTHSDTRHFGNGSSSKDIVNILARID
jgi:UDP-GlcNAc3NAcA epimerase